MTDLIIFLAMLIGITAAAYMAGQSPSFWIGMAKEVAKGMAPIITKRMPPEDEEAWRKCQLRGGKWNHRKRRCE